MPGPWHPGRRRRQRLEPANEANFQRFEGPDRDLYYSGQFDQKSVMDLAGVNATLADRNAQSHGSTFFYLDNKRRRTAWALSGGLDICMTTRHIPATKGRVSRRTIPRILSRARSFLRAVRSRNRATAPRRLLVGPKSGDAGQCLYSR